MYDDTIAAIATALGEGGLAVIRLSGPQALSQADHWFEPSRRSAPPPSQATSHTLHHGYIRREGHRLDEVLLAVMRAPRTYTREDTVEISCHGGLLVAKSILEVVLQAGARLAQPGEFTKRAFLNGRLDLTQAEAVLDLIHARTDLALAAANEQLAGQLSQRIRRLQAELLDALAHLEAHLDFPDEDIAPDTQAQMSARLENAGVFMDELLRTATEGRILRRGIRAAIVGRPNTGKSSLLNQLLGHDRAIVSAIAGTTRDTIEEMANVRGVPVVFIDTAGLRPARDPIELEGIRRSRLAWGRAELVLQVLDLSQPWSEEDRFYGQAGAGKKYLLVANKADLPEVLQLPEDLPVPRVRVSCRTGEGIEHLKDQIRDLVWSGVGHTEASPVAINARHQTALRRAREAARLARQALEEKRPLEIAAMELRLALQAVGEIVGQTTSEDLLGRIFSQFCIGK